MDSGIYHPTHLLRERKLQIVDSDGIGRKSSIATLEESIPGDDLNVGDIQKRSFVHLGGSP
jgi:hypothetical protein